MTYGRLISAFFEQLCVLTFHGIWKTPLPFLSPARREALDFPPSLPGKGVRGLGFALAFPHNVKSQLCVYSGLRNQHPRYLNSPPQEFFRGFTIENLVC